MKIAVITDDEQSISQHFGRAPYYLVVTIEDGKVVGRERRDKLGHAHFADEPHAAEAHEADPRGHGFDLPRRIAISAWPQRLPIAKCCCAVGWSGRVRKHEVGRHPPIVTDISGIDAAVQAYIDGKNRRSD
jgi:hypothetical protein